MRIANFRLDLVRGSGTAENLRFPDSEEGRLGSQNLSRCALQALGHTQERLRRLYRQ